MVCQLAARLAGVAQVAHDGGALRQAEPALLRQRQQEGGIVGAGKTMRVGMAVRQQRLPAPGVCVSAPTSPPTQPHPPAWLAACPEG